MAELLSHVLAAYALGTVVSWRLEWVTKRWVAVAMIGALLPDLNRIGLFVTDATLESVLGVPFSVDAIHTLGGVVLLSAIGAMVVADQHRRVFGVLLAGALSHLLVDAVKAYADGAAGAWLYPVTWARHPTPNLYVSSDPAVLAVVGVTALLVWWTDRTRGEER
ncbi:metal-dependent hydrolase [Natronorubrum texcoconense]|uniref:LexA-binding, inner membrane-associated putative hydrolase n=1 Tax=Natronorubrum texcoconense TaxID=1095776 RepID=A0A1G8UQV0_9EURY|nr:metal-dependent hydrolase [Natronorubrum texcoconense]SDJ56119.1 LexA-binding, inner membrane-associated putative hydrolase [Natronorubrum texcoconense]